MKEIPSFFRILRQTQVFTYAVKMAHVVEMRFNQPKCKSFSEPPYHPLSVNPLFVFLTGFFSCLWFYDLN